MTPHRLLFDLQPIPSIVSIVELEIEPTLRAQAHAIRERAQCILGFISQQDVLPSTPADLAELQEHLKLSPAKLLNLQLDACRDILDFIHLVNEYFSALRKIRSLTDAETTAGKDVERLLNNLRAAFVQPS